MVAHLRALLRRSTDRLSSSLLSSLVFENSPNFVNSLPSGLSRAPCAPIAKRTTSLNAYFSTHLSSRYLCSGESTGTALESSENSEIPTTSDAQDSQIPQSIDGSELTPVKVVEMLDQHIVGQSDAKRAVAVALRNRWRRHKITGALKDEIVPKNILMIGPTGCGKTEIARRLAKLADSPFVKVEATKFTEVGFHGRDVDQIIRDLVENAILLQRQKIRSKIQQEVEEIVENQLLNILTGSMQSEAKGAGGEKVVLSDAQKMREAMRILYKSGALDSRKLHVDVTENRSRVPIDTLGSGLALNDIVFKIEKMFKTPRPERKEMTVAEARALLIDLEIEKRTTSEQIIKDAIHLAESDGIVFIDEIDKIVISPEMRYGGADASSEGVQRDLLPIIEGSVVSTKYGNVNTDHILFICSGAFHSCKPSDMLAELQGRLPIRVELKALTQEDLYRILTEPKANMIVQQKALLQTENVDLVFTDHAIREISSMAFRVNKLVDNIGARRLHTIIERVVEDISFNAPERSGQKWVIDKQSVQNAVGNLMQRTDISRFVL